MFKSADRGQNWTAISPDLTQNTDRETLGLMGVTAKEFTLAKHDGVQSYGNLVQLVESPRQAGVLYAGADDGSVYMTKDDGKSWTNITNKFPGLPKDAYVSRLTASTHDAITVYATFDNHRNDDYGTFVYASVDGGNTFRSIGEGIPKGHAITALAEDPKNANVLYAGSEFGLFVSLDRGGRWQRFKSGLPTVPIHEIVFHPRENDMIVATHGRSIWILDDATPVQQLSEAMKSAPTCSTCARRCSSTRPTIAGSWPTRASGGRTRPTARRSATTWPRRPRAWRCGSATRRARSCASCPAMRRRTRAAWASTASTGTCGTSRCPRRRASRARAVEAGSARRPAAPNVLPGEYRVTLLVAGKEVATKPLRVSGDARCR